MYVLQHQIYIITQNIFDKFILFTKKKKDKL